MTRNFVVVSLIFLLLAATSALAGITSDKVSPTNRADKVFSGDEQWYGITGYKIGATFGPTPNPPGDTIGNSWYDFWQNGSIGRNVTYTVAGNRVHFAWMRWPDSDGPRHIRYNAYNITGGTYAHSFGLDGGKDISGTNGGYNSIDGDADGSGGAIVYWHEGPSGALYSTYYGDDSNPPLGLFDVYSGPPVGNVDAQNCQSIVTGAYEADSRYIWPKGVMDIIGSDEVQHIVSTEAPPDAASTGEIQTIVYYRFLNNDLEECTTPGDTFGVVIDSTFTVNAVVAQDPTTDNVAIVYLKPMIYPPDADNPAPGDPCGWYQWQNEVVYQESSVGGTDFPTTINYVTDYDSSGTLQMDEIEYKAYADVSALYDETHCLHIVWKTPRFDVDGDSPCVPLFACKMWHWDDCSNQISQVYDAIEPRYHCANGMGAFMTGGVAKPSISECDGNLYVSFVRFGVHPDTTGGSPIDSVNGDCSAANYTNGDICITGSSDGGLTWGPDAVGTTYDVNTNAGNGTPVNQSTAVVLTNTWTDGCAGASSGCHSESWSSMARYSVGDLHILYLDDNDAAGNIRGDEGEALTNNAVMYATYPCFTVLPVFDYTVGPVDFFVPVAPTGGSNCTIGTTGNFTFTISNSGNVPIHFDITPSISELVPTPDVGDVSAGVNTTQEVSVAVGTYVAEGTASGTLTVDLTSPAGNAQIIINVDILIACQYYVPEYQILSTSCWSVGAWNVPRVGIAQRGDEGNMYWFNDTVAPMYDESIIISYAGDPDNTFFSMFDGSNNNVDFVALDSIVSVVVPFEYEYTHGEWATPDTVITGEFEVWVPSHPDTCVLIERVKICNGSESDVTIHVGEGIDWDIPDDDGGSVNEAHASTIRQEVYQSGEKTTTWDLLYGGVGFCDDIPGATVLENDVWVYPNSGYVPADIGTLIGSLSGFSDNDSIEDLNSVYAVFQDLTLMPDSCTIFCKVKASALDGLTPVQTLIDKGKNWIAEHEIYCPGCFTPGGGPSCEPGDANGLGDPPVDIDDVVYLINFIFGGGPPPVEDICCGDANAAGDPPVDIDDVVYLINFIFGGGPAPLPAC